LQSLGSGRDDGIHINLTHQVDRSCRTSACAPAGALYVIEIVGNDIRDVAATPRPEHHCEGAWRHPDQHRQAVHGWREEFLVWNALR